MLNNSDEDIRESERRLIQKELFLLEDQKEAAEKRFQTMFENALVGLFRGDVERRLLTDANYEAALTFGFDSVESLILHVNTEKESYNFFETMPEPPQLTDGNPYSFSSRAQRRDGTEFWAQFSVRYTEGGKYIEGAVKDITNQVESMDRLRQAKAEAEEANEAKSRFLATMSHEIRTPLSGVIGFAEILLEQCDGRSRDYARKILNESDRLMVLINQLLDFSRLEANKISLESILFDLHQVLDEAEVSPKKMIGEKGLRYSRESDDDVPRWFLGDPMRLRQILSNLLSNAVKFTEKGNITLKISHENDPGGIPYLRFSVIDTGIGIPEDKIDTIFSSFEQADTSISRKYGGTGLGISICRELVVLMGGELNVQSRIGEGSEFFFTIPLKLPPETMDGVPAYRDGEPSRLSLLDGIRVLLVEDYETNREIAGYHLEKAGCLVYHAENGRKALDFLDTNVSMDLIFMDLHMPVMDGLETTRTLRASGLKTPIIGMTASAYADDRSRSLSAGMNDFLTKPLRRAELLAKAVDWTTTDGPMAGKDKTPENISPTPAVTASSTLRYNEFLDELSGEAELTAELFDGFAKDAGLRLNKAEKALKEGDMERLHREAHSIKGGALNLMADDLAENAFKLEQATKSGADAKELKSKLAYLNEAFNRFLEAWKTIQENNETDEG